MDAFRVRDELIRDYEAFTSGFLQVRDERIATEVRQAIGNGLLWPEPWLSLNPTFQPGGSVSDLISAGLLHESCEEIFRAMRDLLDTGQRTLTLHQHQADAIRAAATGTSYVLTTGTGSGKSLSYIVPTVDRVLREGSGEGIKAIVVCPMNALANSQLGEPEKFLSFGSPGGKGPVTFARHTGQEKDEDRQATLSRPPDILLTNYPLMMSGLSTPLLGALACCLSSFALDFASRQKVGGASMNFFVYYQLPALPPQTFESATPWASAQRLVDWLAFRALELDYSGGDMSPFAKDCGDDGSPFVWAATRRAWLRAELDAAFFHLYGVERDDVDYILDTFPIVRRKDEAAYGEYRTKRLILEVYDAMAAAMEMGSTYQTILDPPPGHGPRHRAA